MIFVWLCLTTALFEFNGQVSGNIVVGDSGRQIKGAVGIEYRPKIIVEQTVANGSLNLEASARLMANGKYWYKDSGDWEPRIAPYRLFLRYGKGSYEIRAGLQQINFGSAVILRPLRWFDRIDPRDPLETTEGVYGLLGRGYFANNSIWGWGLIGNSKPKGLETTPTPRWQPEGGGRLELALPKGEVGLSFHHRSTEIADSLLPVDIPENKSGRDGRWDIGVGIWFEGLLVHTGKNWQEQVMGGIDYTFGIGSGLTFLNEVMATRVDTGWYYNSALSLNYPLTFNDNLTVITFFDWQKRNPYIYFGWQHLWDNWRLVLSAFWGFSETEKPVLPGKALELRIIFNH